MEVVVDHYSVLDLPSDEKSANLTEEDVSKAYKKMALKLHPDKNPNDPNARANFQKLLSSYEILKDPRTRKQFDDLLRLKRQRKTGYGFGLKNSKPPEKASPPDSAHHPSQTCGLAAAAAMLQKIARFLEIVEIVVRIIVTVLEEFKNLEEPAKKKSVKKNL